MSGAPANLIEIKTKNLNLSAAELIAHRHAEVESPRIGLKRTKVAGTVAEEEELKNAYANLRSQLSTRRIERHTGRAIAVWHEDHHAAEVRRKDGKFESFGYSKQGKLYLEYYEALFLLELNRLQLEYCEMIVSVEQAYVLLLGEAASEKYNNYLVYSALSRAGYIVVKHQEVCDAPQISSVKAAAAITSEDCIWAILEETVSNKSVPEHIKASIYYATAQARLADLKHQITHTSTFLDENITEIEPQNDFEFNTRKRRAPSEPEEQGASKRTRFKKSKSLVDNLKTDSNYLRFQETFEKFDIVQLQENYYESKLDTSLRTFKINFDLHLHNEGFKRSAPKSPTFSVVILPADEPFPTQNEMIKCQQQLSHRAPLLVISVSESKQIQAFLYYTS
ncbi:uncharacterized protein LOC117786822 [Drosophila innubila]|uniref:uncharacterized protein LOC117786822 n=1 Tax=Drosophila innubila TaxID=198719 RepID=UPI00148BE01A|nr:uncharacterized protein LOC117786822 [Drosophila innubila]